MLRRGLIGMVAAIALLAAPWVAPGTAAAFEPVSSFGSNGNGAGQLSAPGGIAVGPEGDFFVADTGNDRVDVFSSGGEFRFAFGNGVRPGGGDVCDAASGCEEGEGGGAAGALEAPEGIAISNAGDVYVAEEGNDRVSLFSAQGAFILAFGYRVEPGVEPPEGNTCTAVTGCQAGSNLRVPEEPLLFTQKGPEGALAAPTGVAVGPSGDVYIAEGENNRVSVFGPLGEFQFTFGTEVEGQPPFANRCSSGCIEGFAVDIAGGMAEPTGIATLPGDQLLISDGKNRRLDVFSDEGEFIHAIGHEVSKQGGDVCTAESECQSGSGEGAGALREPAGLAVSPAGLITVGDVGLERVSQFDADGEFVRAFGGGVASGAAAFEVCSALTGCRAGVQGAFPGATPFPFGVAEACGGSIFVSESTSSLSRVERFGESGSAAVCPPPTRPRKPATPSPVVTGHLEPSNLFQLGRLKRDRAHGTATLLVSVPVSGVLELGGRGIGGARRSLTSAGTAALTVRLVGKSRRALLARGHRKVTAAITFTPNGGSPRSESRRLTLVEKQAKPQHRHHRSS